MSRIELTSPESYDVNALNIILLFLLILTPIIALLDVINKLIENSWYQKVLFCGRLQTDLVIFFEN